MMRLFSCNELNCRIGRKAFTVIIVGILCLSGFSGTIEDVRSEKSGDNPPPENGDWVITNKTVVTNETIYLNGNLTIESGGNLTLINTTLIFNCSYDGQYHIEVKEGGELQVLGRKGTIAGAVALWHMDEGSGDTIYDATQNNNDGTIYGAAWVDGRYGKALSFDGVDDYVDCGNDTIFDITDEITLEAWVNYTRLTSFPRAISKQFSGGTTAESCYQLGMTSNRARFAIGGVFDHASSGPTLTTGRWYHIVGTYDRQTARLYLDGEEIWSENYTGEIRTSDQPLTLGISVYEGSTYYPHEGLIDEVRIYKRVISGDEVIAHFEGRESRNRGTNTRSADPNGDGGSNKSMGGRNSHALYFDGNDDRVEITGISGPSSFTFECWVKNEKTTFPGYSTIIEFGNDAPYFGLISGKPGLYQGATASNVIGTDWTHIAVTFDGFSKESKVYVNGEEAGTKISSSVSTSGNGMGIGYHSGDSHFEGAIDEVRVLDSVLDGTAISEDFSAGGYYPERDGTIGWWHFDENEGSTAADSSGNNHDGAIHGATWTNGSDEGNGEANGTSWGTSITTTGSHSFDFFVQSGAVFEIRDTWVRNCGSSSFGYSGMRISADNAIIIGNLFEKNYLGMYLDGAVDAIIRDNTFMNNSVGIYSDDGVRIAIQNNSFSLNVCNIQFVNTTNSIVSGTRITDGDTGIFLNSSSDNTLDGNGISNVQSGIHLLNSPRNTIKSNNIEENEHGILMENSIENNLTGNVLTECGVLILGKDVRDFSSHILRDNTVNDAPLYYLTDSAGIRVPDDAGEIILVNCSGMLVENVLTSSADVGLELAFVNDSHIIGNNLVAGSFGLFVHSSNGNVISGNNLTGNGVGILLQGQCSNNSIQFNDISGNERFGLNATGNEGGPVDARKNFWGHPSGPYNPVANPGGKGNAVTDDVAFEPWLRAPPGENVWYVDAAAPEGGNGTLEKPFTWISHAVDNASRGETIVVFPGIYRENLVINRDVHVSGRSGDVILDAGGGHRVRHPGPCRDLQFHARQFILRPGTPLGHIHLQHLIHHRELHAGLQSFCWLLPRRDHPGHAWRPHPGG